jgi:transcription elongation factor GreA
MAVEPITLIGKQKIQEELDQLVKVDREELKVIIQEARELGDLKENAEYHSAKEKQSHLEGRIMHLQGIVARSQVVDISTTTSETIVFGASVTLFDVGKETSVTYQIVGHDEANVAEGKISYKSPLGKSLLGKEDGDSITVRAPKGDVEYEIESFEFK